MWVIIALIFIGTFVYLFINSSEKDTVYELVSPTNGSIERTTVLTGKIEPRDKIEIKPQVSGIISEINVEAGDQVKEGDIIAKIKVVPDEGQLASAESRVKLAELSLANQKATFSRTKELYEKKFESRENFEKRPAGSRSGKRGTGCCKRKPVDRARRYLDLQCKKFQYPRACHNFRSRA